MGSLENGVLTKQTNQNLGKISSLSKINRPRSRFPRSLISKRLGYFQWISTIVIFFLFLVFFQSFLPGSMVDTPVSTKSGKSLDLLDDDLMYLKEFDELDFGESLRFEPVRLLSQFHKDANGVNFAKNGTRFGYRKPKLALVFADLAIDSYQVLMVTVASALQEIGYSIEVFSSEDGPANAAWKHIGVPVSIMQGRDHTSNDVDWLNYDGVLLNSLEGKHVLSSFMQEPFNSVPLVWTIHEKSLATRLSQYTSNGTVLHDWRKSFNRANVVVFPNYALPISYSMLDTGNYFVIPGAPSEAWEANSVTASHEKHLQLKMDVSDDDFIVVIVGSHFMYKGLWLEHALVLHALKPLLDDLSSENRSSLGLKVFVLTEDSTGNYTNALEVIAASLKYPKSVVKHVGDGENVDDIVMASDLVIYGSFLEERSFPDILVKAMCYEKLVIAPNLSIIQKYPEKNPNVIRTDTQIDDRVNGFIFPKEDIKVLTAIISEVVSRGKLSPLARNIASIGKGTAKNLMVSEVVEGYALLLENILKLPSEVSAPKAAVEIPTQYRSEWPWNIFNVIPEARYRSRNMSSMLFIEKIEGQHYHNKTDASISKSIKDDDFIYGIWEEQKQTDIAIARKRREDQELKGRSDQSRGTWEDVYRNAKRADRTKNDLHERDDRELERTGQPLCIYEPYLGKGTWPFLHLKPLYRGISLVGRGRRPGADDVDAPSRLPLLSNSYYRDLLGEFGAFFAIANRVDRVHKNAWIGFQSWRATAKKAVLSKVAEKSLLQTIEAGKHGDALYFWVRMDNDPRNPLKQDFWSFCDAINAGNCRSVFSDALKRTYGLRHDREALPPMPMDGETWSVMHSWVLPTRSFLEFVMFSRMFVDALDAQMYDEHHQSGLCNLSLSKDKHCYSRVLELLVNVWAYHSARRMIYVDPETGIMQEQHIPHNRRGKMWIKWFTLRTLKSMDEDLAEEADSDKRRKRWLWPNTGEIFWQGIYEKERDQRKKANAERKRKNKDKVERIKNRNEKHHRPIDKYVKPPPEGTMNTTAVVRR